MKPVFRQPLPLRLVKLTRSPCPTRILEISAESENGISLHYCARDESCHMHSASMTRKRDASTLRGIKRKTIAKTHIRIVKTRGYPFLLSLQGFHLGDNGKYSKFWAYADFRQSADGTEWRFPSFHFCGKPPSLESFSNFRPVFFVRLFQHWAAWKGPEKNPLPFHNWKKYRHFNVTFILSNLLSRMGSGSVFERPSWSDGVGAASAGFSCGKTYLSILRKKMTTFSWVFFGIFLSFRIFPLMLIFPIDTIRCASSWRDR